MAYRHVKAFFCRPRYEGFGVALLGAMASSRERLGYLSCSRCASDAIQTYRSLLAGTLTIPA
jgi:hypothetical protein